MATHTPRCSRSASATSVRHNSRTPLRVAAENDGTLFEAVARRSDGALLPVEVRSILVSLDGETAWLSVVRDITERKRAEQAQARAQEFSRVTFEHADVGMAHVGTDGAWLRVNERLCDLLGYSREELPPPHLRRRHAPRRHRR